MCNKTRNIDEHVECHELSYGLTVLWGNDIAGEHHAQVHAPAKVPLHIEVARGYTHKNCWSTAGLQWPLGRTHSASIVAASTASHDVRVETQECSLVSKHVNVRNGK